jgi:hypothetical protein
VTLERSADDPNFNRRYATGIIRAPLPGVETAGLKSAAAHAAKTKVFFQKCPDIRVQGEILIFVSIEASKRGSLRLR